MLDDVIARRTGQDHGRQVARSVQVIARAVVVPAAAVMAVGLVAFLVRDNGSVGLLDQAVIPVRSLFTRATVSPIGAMSVGLLALALLPMVTVLYILTDSLRNKRWADAGAAAAVAAILTAGILLGQA